MNKIKIKLVSGNKIKQDRKGIYEIGEDLNNSRSGRDVLRSFYKNDLGGSGTASEPGMRNFIANLKERGSGIIEMKRSDILKLFR